MAVSGSIAEYVVWLDGASTGRESLGGKGASLSHLFRLGAPVPVAYALTTHAYETFARDNGFPLTASAVTSDRLPALRQQILDSALPSEILASVAHGLDRIKAETGDSRPMAVRSSGTAEDSAAFSFAGLHDTILDVLSIEDIERAILRCWSSLWNDRAIAYRREGGPELDQASMAVVVQQLVRSDVSFVVFTADPISNRDDRLVITASYGLGEAVVSGLVTPDVIVIDAEGEIENYEIGTKEVMIIPGRQEGQGVREVPVPRMLACQPAMSHQQAREIARVARDLSDQLGYPADIEGGFSNGDLYLFQVRPITTLNGRNGRSVIE